MKKLFGIIVVVLIILVALSFAKDIIAKTAVSAGVKVITGLDLSMSSMHVGIFKTLVDIKDMKLHNPSNFPDKLMVDIPQVYVDYDLGAFLKGKVHLEKMRLDLKEFIVVKNQKGELNLDSLKIAKGDKQAAAQKEAEKKGMPEMKIDVLELKIGKVINKDYTSRTPPSVREFNVNINERYENVTNPYTFASLIVFKALMNTSIASLANFDLGPLKEGLGNTLGAATKIAGETATKALEVGKELGAQATETAKEATKGTTEAIKNLLPFGGGQK